MECIKAKDILQPPKIVLFFLPLNRIRPSREDWLKSDRLRAEDRQNGDHHKTDRNYYRSRREYGDLKLGDRIIWLSDDDRNEKGTVRWIGVLPGEPSDVITIGVEFDNPVGTGTGKYKDQRLFKTEPNHASLIPPMGLIKESEYERSISLDPIQGEQERLLENCYARTKSLQQIDRPHPAIETEQKKSLPAHFNTFLPGYDNGNPMPVHDQVRVPSQPNQLDSSLTIGSMVEVPLKTGSFHGVIKWIGFTDGNTVKKTAGIELENESPMGTDGVFKNIRYFQCKPGRALFVPLARCVKDKRFFDPVKAGELCGASMSSPDVPGDIPAPDCDEMNSFHQTICGKNRGIQGHHNSCYLDCSLFSMFYFSTVFDSIFNRQPREDDLPEYTQVQKVLKEGIVNPLRKNKYVSSDKVWKLRVLLDRLGTVPGMMGEEKDVEEFLSALLTQIMKADPLLHLSTGEHAYFYQLFIEKDEKLLLPTTQKLVELSFLQGNVKLKQVPACLMIQMPRFGKDYKMFSRIVPSLELDITDILENSPRDCIVCGDLALWECKSCYQVHGPGLNTTAFCDNCKEKSHQHATRRSHKPERISTDSYLSYFQNKKEEERERRGQNQDNIIINLPREKMELFAVICIQTSHYVSFVKCGPGIDAPWVFFDSMADRIGESGGYNVPEVVHVPEMSSWLSENQFNKLNQEKDKDLPELLRRILCDGYMCMYQSPDVMLFQ